MMQKVLFLTYYFPPIAGSGVFRSAKFAKYLPKFGWQPIVISATEDIQLQQVDPTLLEELPEEVQVRRVGAPHPQPYTALRQWLRRNTGSVEVASSTPASVKGIESSSNGKQSVLKTVFKGLTWPLRLLENPPVDIQLYWSLRIIPLAWRLIRQQEIDVIYTSSAPWSVLLTGLVLKRLTGCPWVLDMRDPWVSNEYVCRDKGLRRRLDVTLEQQALNTADHVVITSAGFMDEIETLAGPAVRSKVIEITNGYDEMDFSIQTDDQSVYDSSQNWVHVGTTIWDRFAPLVDAIARLEKEPSVLQDITFTFHGWCDPRVPEAAKLLNTGSFVFKSAVPHSHAISLMQQSEVLILLLGAQRHWARIYPGKLFEYLRAGKPVLGVGPRGVAAELIERCGVGCFIPADETEKLAAMLRKIACDYPGFLSEYYHPDPDAIAQYERQALTNKLASVFNTLCTEDVNK
jgi:glycosyltransferase involved in cell wall biosynthesis